MSFILLLGNMKHMNGETVAVGASTALVFAGLAVLLYSEYAGFGTAVTAAGGVVVLAGVGVLTAHVARLPDPGDGETSH